MELHYLKAAGSTHPLTNRNIVLHTVEGVAIYAAGRDLVLHRIATLCHLLDHNLVRSFLLVRSRNIYRLAMIHRDHGAHVRIM